MSDRQVRGWALFEKTLYLIIGVLILAFVDRFLFGDKAVTALLAAVAIICAFWAGRYSVRFLRKRLTGSAG